MQRTTHRLHRAIGDQRHAIELLHRIGAVEVYARYRQGQPLDFAVVRGALTVHAPTAAEAVQAMHATLRQREAEQQKEFSWATGLAAGFTPECLTAFCQANQLDPAQLITLGQLRRRVTSNRAANWSAYVSQLSRVGIHLGPPKSSRA